MLSKQEKLFGHLMIKNEPELELGNKLCLPAEQSQKAEMCWIPNGTCAEGEPRWDFSDLLSRGIEECVSDLFQYYVTFAPKFWAIVVSVRKKSNKR